MPKHKNYLSPQKRKYYQDRIGKDERTLEAIKTSTFRAVRSIDPKPFVRRKRKHEKILEERVAPKVRGKSKDKAWRRYKELEEELKDELLRKDDMHPMKTIDGKPIVDWEQAKLNAFKQVKRIDSGQDAKIRELRDLARKFEPDNPLIGNIESLRR